MKPAQILIVEDDDLQYEIYEDALAGFHLVRATSGRQALAAVSKSPPDLIVLDHILAAGELGLDYLPELKEVLPHMPIIVVSGALEVQQQFGALQGPRRAHYCLTKPVDVVELKQKIETALAECGATEIVRSFEALERSRRIDVEALLSRSTDRLARQNQIHELVRDSKERPNVSGLARQFKVARRTIIRDLEEMIRRGQLDPEVFPKWENSGEGDEPE